MTQRPALQWPDDGIILYDGVCVLCSGWVRFVARHDTAGRFRFTPIDSAYGRRLAQELGIDPAEPMSAALVLDGRAWLMSDTALRVVAELPAWRWLAAARFIPRALRDPLYRLIARNRYRVFGRHAACDLGDNKVRARLITSIDP